MDQECPPLGFEITYSFKGVIRRFRQDYIAQLANGKMMSVLSVLDFLVFGPVGPKLLSFVENQ